MQLLDGTYQQKHSYLIDCIGYSEQDLERLGELSLDELIQGSNRVPEYLDFIS